MQYLKFMHFRLIPEAFANRDANQYRWPSNRTFFRLSRVSGMRETSRQIRKSDLKSPLPLCVTVLGPPVGGSLCIQPLLKASEASNLYLSPKKQAKVKAILTSGCGWVCC
jgi:hypothetical protein